MDLIPEAVTNPLFGGKAAVLLHRLTLLLPPVPSEQESIMKRSASSRYNYPSSTYQNLAASSAQRDTGVAGEGGPVESTGQETDHHTAGIKPDQNGPMPFPGPFAYALLPAAAGQPGQAEVPAALNTSATTYATSTATTSSAGAEASAGSAMPEAPPAGPAGQSAPPDNPDGLPPLILAARLGILDQLRMLLRQPGTNVNHTDANGTTALYRASLQGHAAVVECLINAGANVNYVVHESKVTPLMIGARFGRLEVVKALLRSSHTDVGLVDYLGNTALLHATFGRTAAIVECLISAGADANYTNNNNMVTVLMSASVNGQLDVVKALLRSPGILVDQINIFGETALLLASGSGHAAIVECLIKAGANRALLDYRGNGCLYRATRTGSARVVEYLLQLGAPLPDPLPETYAQVANYECLSDLYQDKRMPAASADNPLRLRDPRALDDGDRFIAKLSAYMSNGHHYFNMPWHLSGMGILHTVNSPWVNCLPSIVDIRRVFATPDSASQTLEQSNACFASTLSRLAVLAPDQQIAAPYVKAGLSEAGVAKLSQLGIAQRDKLVALAEAFVAQHAGKMLNQLMPACLARTGFDFQLDAHAFKTGLIDAGLLPPLANMLATCWQTTLQSLAAKPMPTSQLGNFAEITKFIRTRIEADGPGLFAREILRQIDGPELLKQWRATLGESKSEGLFFLFDDQCRQLREYAAQLGEGGE